MSGKCLRVQILVCLYFSASELHWPYSHSGHFSSEVQLRMGNLNPRRMLCCCVAGWKTYRIWQIVIISSFAGQVRNWKVIGGWKSGGKFCHIQGKTTCLVEKTVNIHPNSVTAGCVNKQLLCFIEFPASTSELMGYQCLLMTSFLCPHVAKQIILTGLKIKLYI